MSFGLLTYIKDWFKYLHTIFVKIGKCGYASGLHRGLGGGQGGKLTGGGGGAESGDGSVGIR